MFERMKDSNSTPNAAVEPPHSTPASLPYDLQQQHSDSATKERASDMLDLVKAAPSRHQKQQRVATFFAFICFGLASWIMTNGNVVVECAAAADERSPWVGRLISCACAPCSVVY